MAVAELLATTEYPQIARWIQFPTGAALFLHVCDESPRHRATSLGRTSALRRLSVKIKMTRPKGADWDSYKADIHGNKSFGEKVGCLFSQPRMCVVHTLRLLSE
jgi:hypothetical protein